MSIQADDTTKNLASLQEPLDVGPLKLKNRVVMASLTRSRAMPQDYANDTIKEYYRQRAAGGAGLILSEGTLTSPQGTEWPNVASIYSEKHAEAWKPVTQAVHDAGSLMFAQLWHVGRVAHPDMELQKKFGKPVSAPSPVRARGGKFRTLNNAPNATPEREHPDPWELVEEYRQAAKYAKQAGFDGVEFHGANGYLAAQFLDKNTNKRTDMWGGSVENRARFYVECLNAICEVYPAERVGIKLNPCGGYNDVGMNEEDTKESFGYVIDFCLKKGLAYIQLVRYLPFMDAEYPGEMEGKRAETHLDVLSTFGPAIRASLGKTKLFYNGDISAEEGNTLIEQKKIDAVVIGRSFINNPDLPKRLFNKLPLNDVLGHPLVPKLFYQFENEPSEGYSDYPLIDDALKQAQKTAQAAA